MPQNEFYEQLALELVENNYGAVGLRASSSMDEGAAVLTLTSGLGPPATPTKKKKKTRNGTETLARAQNDCVVCVVRGRRECARSAVKRAQRRSSYATRPRERYASHPTHFLRTP